MNHKATKGKITFHIGEESRPVIEAGSQNVSNSIFREQYMKALSDINRYIGQVELPTDNMSFEKSHNENLNNIFAFIGERGSGKTSCMLSVGKMLISKDPKNILLNGYPQIENKKFHTVDLIDPSFFDKKNNILAIIVAKLFKEFETKAKNRTNNDNYDKKRVVIEKFQETQRNLKCLIEGKELSDDDLDQLIALSAAVDLRTNIHELVQAYLDYFGGEDSMLLLMVDDIDLHTQHAREMVEQIRKYLIQPNIVILMALKVDQLATVKRLHFTCEFKDLLSNKQLSLGTIDEMVDRYLTKLLPHQHRVFMPTGEDYLSMELEIIRDKDKKESFKWVREAVPTLIFQKTRFLFYNSKEKSSRIIPRNLRELRQLVTLLYTMDNYRSKESDDDLIRPEYNKMLFKNYLFDTWCRNNLNREGQEIIQEILRQDDAWLINKRVIQLLDSHYKLNTLIETANELKYILDERNSYFNISLGDVMSVLNYIESISPNHFDQNLLFIIKTFYSIRLYEYYDEMTAEETAKTDNLEGKNDTNKKLLPEVFVDEGFIPLSNYKKIIAGSFINMPLANLLPINSKTRINRGYRRINLDNLHLLINECISIIETASSNLWPEESEVSLSENNYHKVQLVELMMLVISRYIDTKHTSGDKDGYTDSNYRFSKQPYYNENLSNRKNVCLDITAFFYNIIDIESAYRRFKNGDIFFNSIKNVSNSIYSQIKKRTEDREGYSVDVTRWLSWACIRNIEVLEFLSKYLTHKKPKGNNDDLAVLVEYFKNIAAFGAKTYDRTDDNKDYYKIDFKFATLFEELLSQEIIQDVFNSIYDYNPENGVDDSTDSFTYAGKVYNSINVEKMLRNRGETNNRSKTLIKYIKENHASLFEIPGFEEETKNNFTGVHIDKKDIVKKINDLNIWLSKKDGQP